jgi:hypothetical protein
VSIDPPQSRRGAATARRSKTRLAVTLVAAAAVLAGVPTMIALTQSADAATADALPAGAVRASGFAAQQGAQLENTADAGGGKNVGWLGNGDWLRYDDLDLGKAGATSVSLRLAAAYADRPGTVQLRADSPDGTLIADVAVTATGGNQSWRTATAAGTSPGGRHPVFLVIRSAQPNDFVNLNWFSIGSAPAAGTPTSTGSAAPTATATAAPTATGTATATAAPGKDGDGWIPVDQAAWDAQLAAFDALIPPAGHNKNAEFNATCTFSHAKPDDPIIFPGMAGASHMHSFVGNSSTDANSTPESLMRLTASTCKPLEDHSAYWVPTLYEHDQPVQPSQVVVYYGSLLEDKTKTVPMPAGMRMIAGDAKKQTPTPQGAVNQFYCAGGPQDGKTRSTDQNWPVCDGGTLHFTLRFPDCWDGRHLDSPDHKSHVSFGGGGTCPAAFPVAIPALTFSIAYPTSGSADGFKLASGMASSMHGDAFFAWEDAAMAQRVKDCVVQTAQCNTGGKF